MAETSETNEPSEPRDINTRSITTELHDSFLQYAMSVISSRALPDARDGLKPSQRRILVAMDDLNLNPGSGYRKCAKISGDTSGNYLLTAKRLYIRHSYILRKISVCAIRSCRDKATLVLLMVTLRRRCATLRRAWHGRQGKS